MFYIDLVLRVGRLLGTVRSLVVQTIDLLDYIGINDTVASLSDDGHEF